MTQDMLNNMLKYLTGNITEQTPTPAQLQIQLQPRLAPAITVQLTKATLLRKA